MLATDGARPARAIDGKTVRGRRTEERPARPLLSAVSQQLGVVVGQRAVGQKTNEMSGLPELLADWVLTGRVVTVAALLTQRAVAAIMVEKGGIT